MKIKKWMLVIYNFIMDLIPRKPRGISDIIKKPDIQIPPTIPEKIDLYEEFYNLCMEELGQKEDFWGENPKIIEYHNATTLSANRDEIPWCASFINERLIRFLQKFCPIGWTKNKHLVPAPIWKEFVKNFYPPAWQKVDLDAHWLPTFSAAARSFTTWGYKNKLKRGCIVITKRQPNPEVDRHVNVCSHVSGDLFYGVGGNQGNAVNVRAYRIKDIVEVRGFLPEEGL